MRKPPPEWKPWHVSFQMLFSVPFVLVLLGGIGLLPLWLIWAGLIVVVAAIFGGWLPQIGPLKGAELRASAAGGAVILGSCLLMVSASQRASRAAEAEFVKLKAVVVRNDEAAAKVVSTLGSDTLARLADEGLALAKSEIARRDAVAEQQRAKAEVQEQKLQTERNVELEKQSKAAIASQQSKIDALSKDDWHGRYAGYERLIALAPGNSRYRLEAAELYAKLSEMQRRIDRPETNIEVVRFGWATGGFGHVYMLDVTLKNTGSRRWKDFQVTCRNQAPSGTMMGANRGVIMEALAPGQKKRFRWINLGFVDSQVTRSDCEVTGAVPG